MAVKKILFASSEVHPIIKTGGLADVCGSLPIAIKTLRRDIKVIMPAYTDALSKLSKIKTIATLQLDGVSTPVRLLETRLPGSSVTLWLVDSPQHFERPGNPYTNEQGKDWPDNAQRFAVFSKAVAAIALKQAGLDWQPDLVHCHDWQTGLIPALLASEPNAPATVFTIHNLAYQGLFTWQQFKSLALPEKLWSHDSMEFYDQFSFIKGGIIYADMINTVSPRYAQEICTKQFGCGLEGLLSQKGNQLTGILNGVDYSQWNPSQDPHLRHNYNTHSFHYRILNKTDLQRRFGLIPNESIPLIGMIGRLVSQKGFDLLLSALPKLTQQPVQFVILGSGEQALQDQLLEATLQYPEQIAAVIGYDEALAHQIEGGADIFLMPSRFEPCGLNQIYSLRYGTIPIVHRTGGLVNTVINATDDTIQKGTATGFLFDDPSALSLTDAVQKALDLYKQPRLWKKLVFSAMQQDFSWRRSARLYLDLYSQAQTHSNASNRV